MFTQVSLLYTFTDVLGLKCSTMLDSRVADDATPPTPAPTPNVSMHKYNIPGSVHFLVVIANKAEKGIRKTVH